MPEDYASMSEPEQVEAYNKMAEQLKLPAVKRFKSITAGAERLTKLFARLEDGETADEATTEAKPKRKKAERKDDEANPLGLRNGTKKQKAFEYLKERLGKQVPLKALAKHLYGNEETASLMMVI